ncbi:ZIP family metal transporter [Olivibacter sitiensis]|uniref:ZIP family metal transporter n=1 Tax=Olivibacter sitiensis TaxID=376470 RepID=UPI00042898E5|nr:ZIP family metal transporter [Olivibacter sitiensis]
MIFLTIAVLFTSAFVGGLGVFLFRKDSTELLKLLLSFSGSYLFAITIIHLIPDIYDHSSSDPHIIGIYVLGGFLFQLFLERFSEGVEHGHMHPHEHHHEAAFPIGVMVSLCLHAFLEGMPLAKDSQGQLLFGIALHHIPAAFALCSLLMQAALSKAKIVTYLAIFVLMSPLGFLFSLFISSSQLWQIEQYYDRIMAVVVGIFLHISTTILFESSSANHQHFNRKKMIVILIGMGIALLSLAF